MTIRSVKAFCAGVIVGVGIVGSAALAHADPFVPGPTNCGGQGPACAPGIPGPAQCALIAMRTLMPCNWYGVHVAPGTPGSF